MLQNKNKQFFINFCSLLTSNISNHKNLFKTIQFISFSQLIFMISDLSQPSYTEGQIFYRIFSKVVSSGNNLLQFISLTNHSFIMILSYIYVFALTIMILHVALQLRKNKQYQAPKWIPYLLSLHSDVIFFWVHLFFMDIIGNHLDNVGATLNGDKLIFLALCAFFGILNAIMAFFTAGLCYIKIQSKEFLGRKTSIHAVYLLLIKTVSPVILSFADRYDVMILRVHFALIFIFSCFIAYKIYKLIPDYSDEILRIQTALSFAVSALAFQAFIGSIFNREAIFFNMSIFTVLIFGKLGSNVIKNRIRSIADEVHNVKDEYSLAHVPMIFSTFKRYLILNNEDLNFQESFLMTSGVRSDLNLNDENGDAMDTLKLILKKNLIKYGNLAKFIYLDHVSSHFNIYARTYFECQSIINKSYSIPDLMTAGLIMRKAEESISLYIQSNASAEAVSKLITLEEPFIEFKKLLEEYIVFSEQFWRTLHSENIDFGILHKVSEILSRQFKKIQTTWSSLEGNFGRHSTVPYLVYGSFLRVFRNMPYHAGKILKKYEKMSKARLENNEEMKQLKKFAKATIFTIGASKQNLGKILTISETCKSLLGYERGELTDKNIYSIMPAFLRNKHDSFIMDYYETGVSNIINATRELLAVDKKNFLIPVQVNIYLDCSKEHGMVFRCILSKSVKKNTYFMILNSSFKIEEFTEDLQNRLGLVNNLEMKQIIGREYAGLVKELFAYSREMFSQDIQNNSSSKITQFMTFRNDHHPNISKSRDHEVNKSSNRLEPNVTYEKTTSRGLLTTDRFETDAPMLTEQNKNSTHLFKLKPDELPVLAMLNEDISAIAEITVADPKFYEATTEAIFNQGDFIFLKKNETGISVLPSNQKYENTEIPFKFKITPRVLKGELYFVSELEEINFMDNPEIDEAKRDDLDMFMMRSYFDKRKGVDDEINGDNVSESKFSESVRAGTFKNFDEFEKGREDKNSVAASTVTSNSVERRNILIEIIEEAFNFKPPNNLRFAFEIAFALLLLAIIILAIVLYIRSKFYLDSIDLGVNIVSTSYERLNYLMWLWRYTVTYLSKVGGVSPILPTDFPRFRAGLDSNYKLFDSTNAILRDYIAKDKDFYNFFEPDVALRDLNASGGVEYRYYNAFDGGNILVATIIKFLTYTDQQSMDLSSRDFQFIVNNVQNDLLIRSEDICNLSESKLIDTQNTNDAIISSISVVGSLVLGLSILVIIVNLIYYTHRIQNLCYSISNINPAVILNQLAKFESFKTMIQYDSDSKVSKKFSTIFKTSKHLGHEVSYTTKKPKKSGNVQKTTKRINKSEIIWRKLRQILLVFVLDAIIAILFYLSYSRTSDSVKIFLDFKEQIKVIAYARYVSTFSSATILYNYGILNQGLIMNKPSKTQARDVYSNLYSNQYLIDPFIDSQGNYKNELVDDIFNRNVCPYILGYSYAGRNMTDDCQRTTSNGTLGLLDINIYHYQILQLTQSSLDRNETVQAAAIGYVEGIDNYLLGTSFVVGSAYAEIFTRLKNNYQSETSVAYDMILNSFVVQLSVTIVLCVVVNIWIVKKVNRDKIFGNMLQLIPFFEVVENKYLKFYVIRTYQKKVDLIKGIKL